VPRKVVYPMANSQILEIFFLALVAGVILFRLYTVLGRRTGHERPPQDNYRFQPNPDAPQPTLDDKAAALQQPRRADTADSTSTDPIAHGLVAIKLADRSFETEHFLSGARQAYELIVTAFAKGDRAALRPLLNDEVYKAFDGAITTRESAKETVAFTFVGFKDAKIAEASLTNRIADVTVTFGAQFISATTSETGAIIEGDPKSVREVTDVWTFNRDTRARDPNWTLVATSGDLP
jgi:predicted lipid-binding transport protein (Tim44 family)